jgi:hypothetical protein
MAVPLTAAHSVGCLAAARAHRVKVVMPLDDSCLIALDSARPVLEETARLARADFELLPVAVRRAYGAGATVDQVRAAPGVGCWMAGMPPAARALAWEAVNAWGATERRSPVA